MVSLSCPACNTELQRSGVLQCHCEQCESDFLLQITCRECGEPLKRLQGCGAVNFWCDKCNELKSKSTAIYTLLEQKS